MKPFFETADVVLYNSDCREVLAALPAGSVDAVVADPPYGIGYDATRSTQRGIQKFAPIAGDEKDFDPSPFLEFHDVLLWGANNYCQHLPRGVGHWYAWDKVTKNGLRVRIAEYEFAWHKRATKTRGFRHLWSGAYRASEAGRKALHPNQKPLALMQWCIQQMTIPPNGVILDPFAGSGTTLLAARAEGVRSIGIELSKDYCKIIVKRLKEQAAKEPLFAVG